MMTKGDLCTMLENNLKEYRKNGILESVKRNSHMNEYKGEKVSQGTLDAVLVDFINFVAAFQGLDLGLYTKHISGK